MTIVTRMACQRLQVQHERVIICTLFRVFSLSADLDIHMDYNKATMVSTTSSTTDGGSRTQTLKRSVHNDHEEQGIKLNEVGPLYSTHCMHACMPALILW